MDSPLFTFTKTAATRFRGKFLMTVGFPALAVVVLLAAGAENGETVLEPKRLHLGKPGQWEWDLFKDRAIDAERLEIKFQAKPNATEHTLRLWQRDVKLTWPVLLNGRKLGTLVTAETAMESLLVVPPGALREGENVLIIEAPSGLDDIEVGPVILAAKPIPEVLSGATIEVAVTDAETG
ncbi:MAG: hypothetical protein RL693_368, partial [Verrucomicrobiota bacterium]